MYNLRNKLNQKNTIVFLLLILIILILEIISRLKITDSFLFPAPSRICYAAWKMLQTGQLQRDIIITLERFVLGFLLGGIIGFGVGSLCAISKKVSNFTEILVYLMYPMPRFILLPYLILLFGTGTLTKVVFVALGAFFPIVINMAEGINYINKDFLEVAVHYRAKGWKLYKRVILPGSLPYILTGLRVSIGVTLTLVIVAEFLTANDGLGAMMWLSLQSLRIDKLFLGTAIIALLSVALLSLLIYIENRFSWIKVEKNSLE